MNANPLIEKTVAIGSGKGGVGKSTISANLAVLAAREGLRVGLIDLDPLSDLSIVFDLPRELLDQARTELGGQEPRLEDFRLRIFSRLDLLFPHSKLRQGESKILHHFIFDRFALELTSQYDVLILDLPAGIGQEENLSFLPYLKHLVIVSNAEPTSHVSAGGYIKAAREINPKLQIYLWHNKFESGINPDFNPSTLWANYNHYVPDELKLGPEVKNMLRDIAFVPNDASLNLLHADGEFHNMLLVKFKEVLSLIDEQALAELPDSSEVPKALRVVIRHYVLHTINPDLVGCEAYLKGILGKPDFKLPLDQQIYLQKYLAVQKLHPIRSRIRDVRLAVDQLIDHLASDGSMFNLKSQNHSTELTRLRSHCSTEIRKLIELMARFQQVAPGVRTPWPLQNTPMVKNLSGLLLFYYGLYRLIEVNAVQQLISNFVPHRKLKDGRRIRSRYRQIALIIEEDKDYHERYFSLIKRLFPVMQRQLGLITKTGNWQILLFRDSQGHANHNAYLKLLNRTIHDIVNGGLGIHVGVRHNAAAQAIQKGGRDLLLCLREARNDG